MIDPIDPKPQPIQKHSQELEMMFEEAKFEDGDLEQMTYKALWFIYGFAEGCVFWGLGFWVLGLGFRVQGLGLGSGCSPLH